jgi:uncharacterized membrane protein
MPTTDGKNRDAMKPLLQFLRTTLAGGVLFLVPIIVLIVILGKAGDIAHKLVDPLAARLLFESLIGLRTPVALVIGLIVLFCFLAGCFARTALAQRIVRTLETAVLSNVPGYEFFKSVGEGMLGGKPTVAHETVLARIEDAWQFDFLVERLENGSIAVFIPGAPNPYSGAVYFMTADRVRPAAIPLAAAMKCLKRLGAGSNALLRCLAHEAPTAK